MHDFIVILTTALVDDHRRALHADLAAHSPAHRAGSDGRRAPASPHHGVLAAADGSTAATDIHEALVAGHLEPTPMSDRRSR